MARLKLAIRKLQAEILETAYESTCPDLQSWQGLLQGSLSEAQQGELNAHWNPVRPVNKPWKASSAQPGIVGAGLRRAASSAARPDRQLGQ